MGTQVSQFRSNMLFAEVPVRFVGIEEGGIYNNHWSLRILSQDPMAIAM